MKQKEFFFKEPEVAFYKANGFIKSYGPVFSEDRFKEIENLTNLIVNRNPTREPVHVYNLLYKVPSFLDFIIEDPVLDMVESLIGPDFGLLSSSAFIKLPNSTSLFKWHTDYNQVEYFDEISKVKTAAMLLAVTPSTTATGCLQYIPGSHLHKEKRKYNSPPPEQIHKGDIYYGLDESEVDFSNGIVNLELPKGYCSFHDLHIVHGSQPNKSEKDRILLNFWFFSTDVRHIGDAAAKCMNRQNKGRIHLRGTDSYNTCQYSIVGAGKV